MVKATPKKKAPAKQKVLKARPEQKAASKAVPKKKVGENSPWRKTATTAQQRKQGLVEPVDIDKVCEEIAKDKNCIVLCKFRDLVVIAKGISLTINKTNNNPIFQPHDYTKDKTYCVMAVIEFNQVDSSKNPIVLQLKLLGCAVFRIRHHSEMEYHLKELN